MDSRHASHHDHPDRAGGGGCVALILGIVAAVLMVGGGALLSVVMLAWFTLREPAAPKPNRDDEPLAVKKPSEEKKPPIAKPGEAPKEARADPQLPAPAIALPIAVRGRGFDIVFSSSGKHVGYSGHFEGLSGCRFELWEIEGKRKLGQLKFPEKYVHPFTDVSPRGTRLLAHAYDGPDLSIWSLPDGKPVRMHWDPYAEVPRVGPQVSHYLYQMVWCAFLDEERVLTVAKSGRFDVWSIGNDKPIYTVAPREKRATMEVTGFCHSPRNLALTSDRRILALDNGDGFDFYETATGKSIGATDSVKRTANRHNVWAAAFSPDDKSLACRHILTSPREKGVTAEFVTIWNTKDGVRQAEFSIHRDALALVPGGSGPIAWPSARHLILWDGNVTRGLVVSTADGRVQRVCGTPGDDIHRFSRHTPGGRIWCPARAIRGADREIALVAVDFPAVDLDKNPAPADPILHWQFDARGITPYVPKK